MTDRWNSLSRWEQSLHHSNNEHFSVCKSSFVGRVARNICLQLQPQVLHMYRKTKSINKWKSGSETKSGFSKDTEIFFSLCLKSVPPHIHKTHRDTPSSFLLSLLEGVGRLFEMFYMYRTRLLCVPLSYFPDILKDKDKGRGIITCEHKWVWWHLYAIPGHLKSYRYLSPICVY